MALQGAPTVDERFLASGDEAGTAPGDRRFRPDVEGLRAVAVLLVVLYHSNVPRLTGGYVGVDVFFVISGFVITGLLLRERENTRRTSIIDFYARRCRRILPAATLVILITVFVSYLTLGFVSGGSVANDGRWAAIFLSNFHFAAVGTNYFTATRPPSPLQNYWSLSVEEQFYVVYPTLFLLVARMRSRLSMRARLAIVLGIVIIASYALSIVQTASSPAAAYFSPFTRAWELALGALVAVSTSWLKKIPGQVSAVLTWAGLGAVLFSAFAFNAQKTTYPGSLVAVPVVGTALVIAGGVTISRFGAESLLGRRPCGWLGRRSYSLYLWHWPILIIAAEHAGKSTLSLGANVLLLLVALALSMASYRLVENPIRHLRARSKQSVTAGVATVLATLLILSLAIASDTAGATGPVVPATNAQVVLDQVAAASKIDAVPQGIEPTLSQAANDYGGEYESWECQADLTQSSERICHLGDPKGSHLMVVYGDSHTVMWLPSFNGLAKAEHWRLVVLGKPYCPAAMVVVPNPPGIGSPGGPYIACSKWHRWALREINQLDPNVVIVSEDSGYQIQSASHSGLDHIHRRKWWQEGVAKLFADITSPGTKKVVLGNIPVLAQSGPTCLAAHPNDVQACSTPRQSSLRKLDAVERSVAASLNIQYIDPTPWFCSATCTAVIGHFDVYLDQTHVTSTYARYLQNALAQSLNIRVDS